ncbi:MAG: NifU family protein [Clostridiales bacterium]|nr:NifU family protein [Clostridiales bacterium]
MSEILIREIEKVLDERVRPDLALHEGNLKIIGFMDGVLRVRMTGQCSGCPSAEITMENLVSAELKNAFEGIKQVVLENGVSDDLIAEAKKILNRRHGE